ncbi:MAG: hypothetical protein IOC86_00140 [Aestuariivirga sp.]|nr:hypothetical protein [Aestuariivirga sp.]
MDWLWLALQESWLGGLVRRSALLYPAANILHVLGVMGFFALVAVMDLALLGALKPVAPRQLVARLRPMALGLFLLVAATGLVLLAPEAAAIAGNPAFLAKGALLLLALANVIANTLALRRSEAAARLTAGLSLLLWLGVAALGRLIAYV